MPTKPFNRQTTSIDAAGKAIGRIATQAAMALQGKNRATFVPHADTGDIVEITNAAQVKVTGKKMEQKEYFRYSGYPGGMRRRQLKTVMAKNPAEAIEHAVYSMLPKNRLRKDRMKRLKVTP